MKPSSDLIVLAFLSLCVVFATGSHVARSPLAVRSRLEHAARSITPYGGLGIGLDLMRRQDCTGTECPDGCYIHANDVCCPSGYGACLAGQACCGSGCVPLDGSICCSDGGYCNPGRICATYQDEDVCCLDSSCTELEDTDGSTYTITDGVATPGATGTVTTVPAGGGSESTTTSSSSTVESTTSFTSASPSPPPSSAPSSSIEVPPPTTSLPPAATPTSQSTETFSTTTESASVPSSTTSSAAPSFESNSFASRVRVGLVDNGATGAAVAILMVGLAIGFTL